MRVCIYRATKHIIEMQSHATEGTLLQNAINAGYTADQVEEREVDEAGYEAAKALDPVEIAAKQAAIDKTAAQAVKAQAFLDNLPSRAAIKIAINAAFPDTKQNAIVTKLANVVYWLARDKAD